MPFLGKTIEEAQAKYEKSKDLLSVQSDFAKISGFTGVDSSQYALDQPFKFGGPASKDGAITGTIQNMKTVTDAEVLPTLEEFAKTYK